MKMYRDAQNTFYRTQADAIASGKEWEPIEVPTDHKGLCNFLNAIQPPLEMLKISGPTTEQMLAEIDFSAVEQRVLATAYENGQPTTPYMGSRDPGALFTCTHCGKDNRPKTRPKAPVYIDPQDIPYAHDRDEEDETDPDDQ